MPINYPALIWDVWLLVPEYLRLGTWDLLQGTFGSQSADDLNSRIAMQLVNEAALCVNRIRVEGSLCNQGFSLVNGLSFLAADETVHDLLNHRSVQAYEDMQIALMQIRGLQEHYDRARYIDHRPSQNTFCYGSVPCLIKRNGPEKPLTKCCKPSFAQMPLADNHLHFAIGSSGKNCSPATLQLINMVEQGGITKALLVADKEHFTRPDRRIYLRTSRHLIY